MNEKIEESQLRLVRTEDGNKSKGRRWDRKGYSPGYEEPKIASRVASSAGVLFERKETRKGQPARRSERSSEQMWHDASNETKDSLPRAQDARDTRKRGSLKDSNQESQSVHSFDGRHHSHETCERTDGGQVMSKASVHHRFGLKLTSTDTPSTLQT